MKSRLIIVFFETIEISYFLFKKTSSTFTYYSFFTLPSIISQ